MGFMDGIRDVLGGFNAVKQIDADGFDWREKRAAAQAARDQEVQQYEQANQDYLAKSGAEALVGGAEPQDIAAGLPASLSAAQRKFAIDRAAGGAAQSKSALKYQDRLNKEFELSQRHENRAEEIKLTGVEAQALARVRAAEAQGMQPSPRDKYIAGEAMKRVSAQQAGANARDANGPSGGGRGGRPQLRLVSDGKGGTEYRWISPGETAPGAPTATQRETAGMAGNISDVLQSMEEIAPDVTYGPIAGRISEAVQSQYPSGKEADFDQYIKQLVDLAYIKSGKQINKQELEMQLRGMISRSKGDLPGQVKRAKPYIENILKPYEKSGAIQPTHGPAVKKRTLPNGKTQFRDAQGNVWEE